MKDIEKLVKKACAGDKKAFEEIYNLTYRQVYFTCMAFVKNEQDAADISQDVYLVVMEKLPELKEHSRFENWLGKITVNKCKDYLKKKSPIPMEEEVLAEIADDENELLLPEEYVMNEEKCRILHKIIREELSDVLYQTVVLFYYQNMTAAEIAELLGCPVGTITARLCVARNKIKEAILKDERKNNYKLHSLVLVPIFMRVFQAEASAMEINTLTYATSTINNAVGTGAAVGGKAMFKTLQAKIIAAVLAVAVVGGGITAGVLIAKSSGNEEDKKTEQTANGNEAQTTTANASESDGNIDNSTEENFTGEANVDYTAMAEDVLLQIEEFFAALTEGDVDTLVSMADENEECYEAFVEISQYECTSTFITTIFGKVKYCINEENLSDLAYDLEYAFEDGDEYLHLNLAYSKPILFLMGELYPMAFSDGTIVPAEPDAGNNEDAMTCLDTAMSVMPMVLAPDFWIKLPDENGEIKICIDHIFGDLELEDMRQINENYPVTYVYENLSQPSDIIIGDAGNGFADYNEEVEELDRLLKAKDFDGFASYLQSITGTDYKSEYEATYGSYDALSDEQKNFVDEFVANEFNYKLISYSLDNPEKTRSGILFLTFPVLNDLENRDIPLTDWYIENRVMEYSVKFPSIESLEQYSEFLWRYYCVIQYAMNNI